MLNLQRNLAGYNWTAIWVAITFAATVVQIALLAIPDEARYWAWYDTSTDILELALTLALFSAVSYTKVSLKIVVAGLVAWQFYCTASQFISDHLSLSVTFGLDISLIVAFITVAFIIGWAVRFSIHWKPDSHQILPGKFYEVLGRPSNLSQLGVATYTGRGGSFAITDGANVWCYSRTKGCMIRKELSPGYIVGKMSVEICKATGERYLELNLMVGRKFSPLHNCLELQALAEKWR